MSRRRDTSLPRADDAAGADTTGDEPTSGFRLIRPAGEPPRRWNRRALLLAGVIGLAALASYLAWMGISAAASWLHDRPEYRVAFDQIELDPAPPNYMKSGAVGLLERVRHTAQLPQELSSLKLDPKALAGAFALGSPWVEEVRSVRVLGYPNRVVVSLRYRRPVAFVGQRRRVWLDSHGVVLPDDDFDPRTAGPLVELADFRGSGQVPRAGLMLESEGGASQPILLSALKLATFLHAQDPPAHLGEHRFSSIGLANGPRWLSLHSHDGYRISWGEAPGEESPGRPKAADKWDALAQWFEREHLSQSDRETHFLSFAGKSVVVLEDKPAG